MKKSKKVLRVILSPLQLRSAVFSLELILDVISSPSFLFPPLLNSFCHFVCTGLPLGRGRGGGRHSDGTPCRKNTTADFHQRKLETKTIPYHLMTFHPPTQPRNLNVFQIEFQNLQANLFIVLKRYVLKDIHLGHSNVFFF